MRHSNLLFLTAATGLALSLSALSSSAAVIYQDSFTGTGSLNGQAPTTANTLAGGSSSATWSGGSWGYTLSGGGGATTSPSSEAVLPFTVQSGQVYTLSATITTISTADSAWLAFGFVQTNTSSGGYDNAFENASLAGPWLLTSTGGASGYEQAFAGPATANFVTGGTPVAGAQTYTITLNTTGTQWTSTFAGPGFTTTTFTYGTNPTGILGIGLGQASNSFGAYEGTVNNIQLTVATPEPSTYALMLGGLVALIAFRRMAKKSDGGQVA